MECPIETEVTLYKGCERIDFKVEIENRAENHVITAKFPTDFINPVDYSHVSFDEVERDNRLFDFDKDLRSTQSFLKPMQYYAGIKGEDGALNVIARGIYEYQTKPSEKGLDLYLTLLKSTSYMFRDIPISWQSGQHSTTPIISTEDSKELGKSTFYYSLYFGREKLSELSQQYIYPLRSFDVRKDTKGTGEKLKLQSFIHIDNSDIVLTAVKKHEYSEGIVLRLYNSRKEACDANISLGFSCSKGYYADLLENPKEELEVKENRIAIKVGAKKIITLVLY